MDRPIFPTVRGFTHANARGPVAIPQPLPNMSLAPIQLLTVNSGSTSVKFSMYGLGQNERRLLSARCEGVGQAQGRCLVEDESGRILLDNTFSIADHVAAAHRFLDWLTHHSCGFCIDGIGHRLVHGGTRFADPVLLTPEIEEELGGLRQLDPEHLVPELKVVHVLREMFPGTPQVACFDTAFHRSVPRLARIMPIPRELTDQGVLRYGSHGLSYQFLMEELAHEAGNASAHGRVVLAHLGGAASMAAVHEGRCVDATNGFVPNGGLMMGSRAGDLCPGVILHLLLQRHMTPAEVNHLVNFQSGLLGVSKLSRDMRELLRTASTHPHAAEAIDLFCYQARKHLGALVAVLGGIDTLVFSGGIGQHAPVIRRKICDEMGYLGLHLDPARNRQNAPVISSDDSRVCVRVIATNEERVIARETGRIVRSAAARVVEAGAF